MQHLQVPFNNICSEMRGPESIFLITSIRGILEGSIEMADIYICISIQWSCCISPLNLSTMGLSFAHTWLWICGL